MATSRRGRRVVSKRLADRRRRAKAKGAKEVKKADTRSPAKKKQDYMRGSAPTLVVNDGRRKKKVAVRKGEDSRSPADKKRDLVRGAKGAVAVKGKAGKKKPVKKVKIAGMAKAQPVKAKRLRDAAAKKKRTASKVKQAATRKRLSKTAKSQAQNQIAKNRAAKTEAARKRKVAASRRAAKPSKEYQKEYKKASAEQEATRKAMQGGGKSSPKVTKKKMLPSKPRGASTPSTPSTPSTAVANSGMKKASPSPSTAKKKGGTKYPVYKKSSKEAQSFRSAFRKARASGKKTFSWQGRSYSTKLRGKK